MYHCDSCATDLSDVVRIKCAVCEDFDLCVECFASGVELNDHKSEHAYRVMDTHNYPVLAADWGADEELALLDGIKMYGMGNWEDIADHIGTKTKLQVEEHYLQTYINCPTYPLPTFTAAFSQQEIDEFRVQRKAREAAIQHEKKLAGERPPKPPPVTSQPACHEVSGYMPLRQEFDVEYDNDAEIIVSQLAFTDEDTPEDKDLKLKVLQIYNQKLDIRKRRRDFTIDRQLINLKQQLATDKRRKDEKDLVNQSRVYALVQSTNDFDLFVDGLVHEQRLRKQISQLQEWRRNGVTTLAGGEQFEQDKKKRATEVNKRMANFATGKPRRDDMYGGLLQQQQKNRRLLDLSNAEDVQLLSPKEYELCSVLRLQPKAYLTMKDLAIRENNTRGSLRLAEARRMFHIDVNKTSKLYDFFIAAGWIRRPSDNAAAGIPSSSSSSSSSSVAVAAAPAAASASASAAEPMQL